MQPIQVCPAPSPVLALAVHRDKQGQRIDPKLEKLKQREEERKRQEKEVEQLKWGRGCVVLD